MSESLVANVSLASRSDQVVIRPRNPAERNKIGILLRGSGIISKATSTGLAISFEEASRLETMPGLRVNWDPGARIAMENRTRPRFNLAALKSEINEILIKGSEYAKSQLITVLPNAPLDSHQWVNVAAMTLPDSPGLCLFDEQGLGKTVSCIFAFDVLIERNEIDLAIVLAPKSMVPEWPVDFARFMGDRYRCIVVTGSHHEKLRTLQTAAEVIVTNYETTVSMEDQLIALCRARNQRVLLIVDESFFVKNRDARRTSAIRRIREYCSRAFVLCGTPAPNSAIDIVEQVNISDFGRAFQGCIIPDDREAANVAISAVLEERGLYVRHTKTESLPDLPTKSFNRIFVPMEPIQAQLYGNALKGYLFELNDLGNGNAEPNLVNFLARRSALLQICSNPSSVSEDYLEIPAKLLALDSLLDELIGKRKEKVIIWSFYQASIEKLCNRYAKHGAVRYDGTVSDIRQRREAVKNFQNDNSTMLFVANPAAAGAGITLHRAKYAIYESQSNQAAHYLQSIDRIHRRGQTRDVEYIVLLCEDSIEIQNYNTLIEKQNAASLLLGDPDENPITREVLLAEATQAWNVFEKSRAGVS